MSDTGAIVDTIGPDELDEAFRLYEDVGSMKAVASALGRSYDSLRNAMMRDPLRLLDARAVRAERVAQRWEGVEERAANLTLKLLAMSHEMVDHIMSCHLNGVNETDIPDPYDRKGDGKMTPMHAMQWLMEKRILEQGQKTGLSAAKIAEGFRQLAVADGGPGVKSLRDQAQLGPDEIAQTISEMEQAGLPLPPGLAHWKSAQAAK